MTTYKNMTVEHLGDNATQADLEEFVKACETRQSSTKETDEEVTAWVWGNGDWGKNI